MDIKKLTGDISVVGQIQLEDIANIALFLASDESRMVNGAVIPAEGGMSVY